MDETIHKRSWCYCMKPPSYDIRCDICDGSNISWSEFEEKIWCFDCEKDTPGTGGIFRGPLPVAVAGILGISFDRIDLETGNLLKMRVSDGGIHYEKHC